MRRRHCTPTDGSGLPRATRSALLVAVLVVVMAGCSDDGEDTATTTTASTTTAPIPAPGGQAVEELDACDLVDEERMASYLEAVDAPAVTSTSSDATVIASVCAWFVEDRDEVERPDRVLLRVEPVQAEGNFVCEPPEFTDTEDLRLDEGAGWVTAASPVETASVVGDWCAYLAAPESAGEPLDATSDATAELLAEVQASLPR